MRLFPIPDERKFMYQHCFRDLSWMKNGSEMALFPPKRALNGAISTLKRPRMAPFLPIPWDGNGPVGAHTCIASCSIVRLIVRWLMRVPRMCIFIVRRTGVIPCANKQRQIRLHSAKKEIGHLTFAWGGRRTQRFRAANTTVIMPGQTIQTGHRISARLNHFCLGRTRGAPTKLPQSLKC